MGGATQAWLVALSCAACASGTARFPTRDLEQSAQAPRRPPGVAVDPRTELPAPSRVATVEPGVLVLSTPHDLNAAADLVAAFFRAITLESGEALDRVLSSDASLESSSGRHPARNAWRSRFTQFDYGALRATPLYRAGDLETYRGNDQAALGLSRRLPPMQPEDVFIRVHLDVTHVNKTRLFADEIGFLLRPAGAGYRISTLSEEFQLL
jgi:hypothetical protein